MSVVKNLPKEIEDFQKWCEENGKNYKDTSAVKEWCNLKGKGEQ
jgi:hypothetical protein